VPELRICSRAGCDQIATLTHKWCLHHQRESHRRTRAAMRARLIAEGIRPSFHGRPPVNGNRVNGLAVTGRIAGSVVQAVLEAAKNVPCAGCAALRRRLDQTDFALVELASALHPRQPDAPGNATFALQVEAERRRLGLA
jgi:hypothetical protein